MQKPRKRGRGNAAIYFIRAAFRRPRTAAPGPRVRTRSSAGLVVPPGGILRRAIVVPGPRAAALAQKSASAAARRAAVRAVASGRTASGRPGPGSEESVLTAARANGARTGSPGRRSLPRVRRSSLPRPSGGNGGRERRGFVSCAGALLRASEPPHPRPSPGQALTLSPPWRSQASLGRGEGTCGANGRDQYRRFRPARTVSNELSKLAVANPLPVAGAARRA